MRTANRADLGKTLELVIQPTCEVKVSLTCRGLERLAKGLVGSNVNVYKDGLALTEQVSKSGEHRFHLPPSEFDLYAQGADTLLQASETRNQGRRVRKTDRDRPATLATCTTPRKAGTGVDANQRVEERWASQAGGPQRKRRASQADPDSWRTGC